LSEIKGGTIFHAVASAELKREIETLSRKRKIPCCDVTGPVAKFLETATGIQASASVKPLHRVDSGYLGRMEALEFAMQHDDSRRIENLGKADVILVGISRVSKSPTALFLAYRGFRVSNISIVPSEGLPQALDQHRGKNVVALTLQPKKLFEIRKRRFSNWQVENMAYDEQRSVIREVMEAEKIYRKKHWPMIDTTELAVEETSTKVLKALHLMPRIV